MNNNVNNENKSTNNSGTPQSNATTPNSVSQSGAPTPSTASQTDLTTSSKESEFEEIANNSESQSTEDASDEIEQQGVDEVSDNGPQGEMDDYGAEEYFPEAYDPNTRYGQYKSRQEQLQREADAIKQRQLQRDERRKSREEDSSDDSKDDSQRKDESETEESTNQSEKSEQNNANQSEFSTESSDMPEKKDDVNAKEPSNKSGENGQNDNQKTDNKQNGEDRNNSDHNQNGNQKKSSLGSKLDKAGEKIDNAKSKINKAQQTANKVSHPVSAAKDEIKNRLKKKLMMFLAQWWWAVAIAAAVLLVLLIILLIFMGDMDEEDEFMLDPAYDFTLTMVTVTNNYQNESDKVELERVSFNDYVIGAAYAEFYDKLDDKTSEQKMEIYKAYFLAIKSIILSYGEYNAATKEITIKNGTSSGAVPSCNIYLGCNVIKHDRVYTFLSANSTLSLDGDLFKTIEPASSSEKSLLINAYYDVKYLLLVPSSIDTIITEYYFDAPPYNSTIRQQIIESDAKYDKTIRKISEYSGFKIYDIKDYVNAYSYAAPTAYWWPVGSKEPTEGAIYGGTPTTVKVVLNFGQYKDGEETKMSNGIDIIDENCIDDVDCVDNETWANHVIVATREGKVHYVEDGISDSSETGVTSDYSRGNFVMIYHGDGIYSTYSHLKNGSITVKQDELVSQGQIIGLMGASGSTTDSRLHFELYINNANVDPLEYINADNPRPKTEIILSGYQEGNSSKQSVCLSLKDSNYSNNAVAAIMTNMQAESSFNPNALGDHGTSYGLCQWHAGRFDSLKSYCGDEYTTIKCQLQYLKRELETSYTSVYNMLLSNISAYDMASEYCINFEAPYNRYVNCPKRATNYAYQMLSYVENGCN